MGVFKSVQKFVRVKPEEIWNLFYENNFLCQLIKTEGLWLLYPTHSVRNIEELLKTSQNIRVNSYQKLVIFWNGTSHRQIVINKECEKLNS